MTDSALPPWAEGPPDAHLILNGAANFDHTGEEDCEPNSTAGAWQITSDGEAEWAMAHLAAAQAQLQAVVDQAKLWQAKLDDFRRAGSRQPERTIAFFTERLERYGRIRRELVPDVATLRFASGDVATTLHAHPKVVVIDERAVIDWSKEYLVRIDDDPDPEPQPLYDLVVTVKESVRVSDLREFVNVVWVEGTETEAGEWRVVTQEGELVPGVDVEAPHVTATAKPRPVTFGVVVPRG